MAYLYFAVPPLGNAAAAVVTGVYLRMGTYVNDPANPVDEASVIPATYTGGASASEGILISSAGTYIVTVFENEGHIELMDGATLNVTGEGDMTTTIESGNVSMTIANGAFTLEGHSGFNVKSEDGDISIAAEGGKVSSKGNYIYNHTYGYYVKINLGAKKSGTLQTSTNVSVSVNLSIYLALLFSVVMASLDIKVVAASVKGLIISTGLFQLDFNNEASIMLGMDTKYSLVYLKFRGIQLEHALVDSKQKLAKNKNNNVEMKTAMARAEMAGVKTWFGLGAKFP
jgi:hypothetical protein